MNDALLSSASGKEPVYAGFTIRFFASIIDTMLSSVLLLPFAYLYRFIFPAQTVAINQQLMGIDQQAVQYGQILELLWLSLPSFLVQTILLTAVVLIFWFTRSATPGKMLLSLKIIDANTLAQPQPWQMVVRYFGYIIAFLPLGMGFVWIQYDKKKQGWHDKIASTVVVRCQK